MIKSIKKQSTQLLIGYTISGLGDQFYTFAIPLLMLTRSHSSITMGLLTAMEYLPTALFGIIIGSIFDIFLRKNIMLYSLLMQSILILIIPLITVYKFPIWLILITIFFYWYIWFNILDRLSNFNIWISNYSRIIRCFWKNRTNLIYSKNCWSWYICCSSKFIKLLRWLYFRLLKFSIFSNNC